MPHLILLRHAKAESVAASGRDFDRGLTARGRRDAAIMGRVLAERGLTPDLVLVSAARRAMETWEEAQPAFPLARVEITRPLYLASCEQLAMAAEANRTATCLMLVGHNPGLHELALQLAGHKSAGQVDSFPTAAAAVFDIDGRGVSALLGLYLPKDHGGGAS